MSLLFCFLLIVSRTIPTTHVWINTTLPDYKLQGGSSQRFRVVISHPISEQSRQNYSVNKSVKSAVK